MFARIRRTPVVMAMAAALGLCVVPAQAAPGPGSAAATGTVMLQQVDWRSGSRDWRSGSRDWRNGSRGWSDGRRDWRDGYGRHRYGDRHYGVCQPDHAVRKALRMGISYPGIWRVTPRVIVVGGNRYGRPASVVFSRSGGRCPVVASRGF